VTPTREDNVLAGAQEQRLKLRRALLSIALHSVDPHTRCGSVVHLQVPHAPVRPAAYGREELLGRKL